MTRERTVTQKVGDWNTAFEATREAITPAGLRNLIDRLASFPVNDATDAAAYASLVQSSMSVARIVAANDRAAAISAAMLTQSGVSRPVIGDTIEEGLDT